MSRLEIRLLGSPEITLEGKPIVVDTRKAIALLAYLAVTGQRHTRDALAVLLWPDYNQTDARAALRRTLSALNKALSVATVADWLAIDRESLALIQSTDVWIDGQEFHRQLVQCRQHGHPESELCPRCLPLLHAAAELYRGDFMAGFTLRDSSNFDDWQFFQAESFRLMLASSLERLVRGQTAQGDYEPAIAIARRWLALDPLHEPAHRALMQLYAWAGQRSAALRQYRECVRILEEELGVPPLAETTQLYQAINEHRERPPQPTGLTSPLAQALPIQPVIRAQGPPAQSRLAGRREEWRKLLQVYHAIANTGQLIIIEGEGGIGKTRLADAFVEYARGQGAPILAARCYVGEATLAYSPIIQCLRAALVQPENTVRLASIPVHWLIETARLLPELAGLLPTILHPGLPPAPSLESAGAQNRFFEGVSQVLLALTQGRAPGILYLDDLHWADSASRELLSYLARRLNAQPGDRRPLCILLTWRSEEVTRKHPLRQLVTEAQRTGAATILTLERLDQAAILELLRATALPSLGATEAGAMEAGAMEALGKRLYQESEGLPLMAVEYLDLIASGVTPLAANEWQLPVGVRDLLHSRLGTISDASEQILNTAAVIGRSFPFDIMREASGRSEEECVAALEDLLSKDLILEVAGHRDNSALDNSALIYDFCHEKLRTIVYEETSLPRRRLLHRRVAETLLGQARRRGQDVGEIASLLARHYALAGLGQEAAGYAYLAGERARALFANREALAHFQAALAHGYPKTVVVHTAIGDLHTLLGEYKRARQSYETAASLAKAEELGQLEHKLGQIYHRLGLWESAESHYQAALAALVASSAGNAASASLRAHLFADRSLAAHQQGKPEQARALAEAALTYAQTALDRPALAQAHNILGILARHAGAVAQATHHLEQSVAIAESVGDPALHIAAINNLALLYSADGQTVQAISRLETALALCERQGDRHRAAALHNNLADLYHASGQTARSMAHLKQAVIIFAEIGGEVGRENADIWKLTEW